LNFVEGNVGRLENKTAIVTGGAGGIGKEAGRLFAAEGANVLLVDRDGAALQQAVREIGSSRVASCVADAESTRDYVRAAVDRFGGIDILLANAGIEGKVLPITECDEDTFDRVIAVNVRGVWLGIKYAFPELRKRGGGSIVITSSVAGVRGAARMSPYITSKHAVVGLMKSAALEGAPHGIRVNTVNPSAVETRMMRSLEEGFMPGRARQIHDSMAASIPLQRYAEPADVAKLMLFLASDDAAFLTGSVYMADGGSTAK
jgi:NAD(P)-dependent dehydrogenase (short-subunit alcohol dehydrogenase family)